MSKSVKASALPGDHPVSSRKTIQTIDNEEGEIIQADPVNYCIQSANMGLLLPFNLPEDFQKAGMKIRFSGQVKEEHLNELTAGHPFVLTELHSQ